MKNLRKMSTYEMVKVFKQINDILCENKVKGCLKKTILIENYLYNNSIDFNDDIIKDICSMY